LLDYPEESMNKYQYLFPVFIFSLNIFCTNFLESNDTYTFVDDSPLIGAEGNSSFVFDSGQKLGSAPTSPAIQADSPEPEFYSGNKRRRSFDEEMPQPKKQKIAPAPLVDTVVKKGKSLYSNFGLEANTQDIIRKKLKDHFGEKYYRSIPKIFGYNIFKNEIEMEKFHGETLTDLINTNSLSLVDFLKIFVELIEIINAIHQVGFSHEDLHPGQILINTHTFDFRLIDFGASSTLGSVRTMPVAINFKAPERIMGTKMDTKADIFSLGRICQSFFKHSNFDLTDMNMRSTLEGMLEGDSAKRINLLVAMGGINRYIAQLKEKSSYDYASPENTYDENTHNISFQGPTSTWYQP